MRREHTVLSENSPLTRNPTAVKREVNEIMRDGLRARGDPEPIAFFCECRDARCYQAVWLTGPAYDEARADPGWFALVAGHDIPTTRADEEPATKSPRS